MTVPGGPDRSSSSDLSALEAMLLGARQELDQLRNDVQARIASVESELREVKDSLDLLTERSSASTETTEPPPAQQSTAYSPAAAPDFVPPVIDPGQIASQAPPEPMTSRPAAERVVAMTDFATVTAGAVYAGAPDLAPSSADLSVDEVLHQEFAEYQPEAFPNAPPASTGSPDSPDAGADVGEGHAGAGDDFFARRSR